MSKKKPEAIIKDGKLYVEFSKIKSQYEKLMKLIVKDYKESCERQIEAQAADDEKINLKASKELIKSNVHDFKIMFDIVNDQMEKVRVETIYKIGGIKK